MDAAGERSECLRMAERLAALEKFGIKPGLERTRHLLAAMGSPERRLRFIHVAGTNGKGSVCAMLAAMLAAAGVRTGLYTSPHLVTPRERLRVDGRGISPGAFARLAARALAAAESPGVHGGPPTFFEVVTAMAARWFADEGCQAVVWETGLGGRLDATNAVSPLLSVITSVDFDHADRLGPTLGAIASEKAGIIKPGAPALVADLPGEAMEAVSRRLAETRSPLLRPVPPGDLHAEPLPAAGGWLVRWRGRSARLPLAGVHQIDNLRAALAALDAIAAPLGIDPRLAFDGLPRVSWPARLQTLPDGTLLDGAHNPHGARALAASLAELFPGRRFELVYGSIQGKNPVESVRVLAPACSRIVVVPVASMGAAGVPPEALAEDLRRSGVPAEPCASLREAFARTDSARRLVAGSLYMAGEVLQMYFTEDEMADGAPAAGVPWPPGFAASWRPASGV